MRGCRHSQFIVIIFVMLQMNITSRPQTSVKSVSGTCSGINVTLLHVHAIVRSGDSVALHHLYNLKKLGTAK